MFSTSAFAVLATDVFSSGVNVAINQDPAIIADIGGQGGEVHYEHDNELVGGTISNIDCINGGVSVPCTMTGTARTVAPYDAIDSYWPTPEEFAAAPIITVANTETRTINPGVYNTIEVAGNGNNLGVLIMNPGIYLINQYIIAGQVLPGDANGTDLKGTVVVLVKSELDFGSSYNNCTVGHNNNGNNNGNGNTNTNTSGPYDSPNRYVFYTEDIEANVDTACISGYMYLKHSLKNAKMNLWGAISAESVTLQNGSNVYVDLEHLIFADFDAFLEVGPKTSAGWHMVKAPAEISATNIVTVNCFFGDDLNISEYGKEWIVYQRDYNGTQSYYTALTPTTKLEKNRGYWLGLEKDADLKVLGLNPIVWDENIAGCTSKYGCYRYTLQSCSAEDTRPSLYNLVGSVGSSKSDWVDYRVEVNGTVMTPSEAHDANIMSNQIWKYIPNGSLDSANAGEYQTADDTGLLGGDSTIDYYDGFWVEVNCTNSVGKTIDLIVPNRM